METIIYKMKLDIKACLFVAMMVGMLQARFQENITEDQKPKCDPDLPTMTVASENLISSKQEWDAFLKKHPFFVLGVGDSTCKACC